MKNFSIEISKEFNQRIELVIGELLALDEVDVIVNPTDTQIYADREGSICKQIWEQGGSAVQKEMSELKDRKNLSLNNVYVTTAGKLKAKYIFHLPLLPPKEVLAVRERGRKAADVFYSVVNILEAMRDENLTRVAIPQLGKSETLVEAIVQAIISFLRSEYFDEIDSLSIFLVVDRKEEFQTYKYILESRKEELTTISLLKEIVKDKPEGEFPINEIMSQLPLESEVDVAQFLRRNPIPEIHLDWRRNRMIKSQVKKGD